MLDSPGSYGNCPPHSLCFCLLLPGSQGPSCHWMGCGKTGLMSRADISICLPDSSDACKLHQDFISPPLSNTQPCLAPASLAFQQVTDYIPASAPSLQMGPLNPEDQHSTASPELLREGNHSSHPLAKMGARPPFWAQRGGAGDLSSQFLKVCRLSRKRMAHGNSNPNILKRPGQAKPKSTSMLNSGPRSLAIKMSRSLFLQVISPGDWEEREASCLVPAAR